MKAKRVIAGATSITMLIMIAGCGSSESSTASASTGTSTAETSSTLLETSDEETASSGKTKITVLRPGDEEKVAAFLEPAVAQFEKDNPDIDVDIMYESWSGWIQTYATYFEANNQPDVIFWWDNKLHDSSAEGHLVDLSQYLDDDFTSQIPQSVWDLVDTGDMDGLYYIPSSVDTFALYYNKDVFTAAGLDPENPPTTWDELLADAKAIDENTDAAGIGIPAITGSEVLEEFVGLFINQATDAAVLDENSEPQFDTPEGQEALDFVTSLSQYCQDSPTEYGRGELRSLLRDGSVGMIIDGPWAVVGFQEAFGEDLDESKIGIASVPFANNGKKIDWAGTNGWIATKQETAEASAKLIKYLMEPDVLEQHHLAYGSAPLYESEFDNEHYSYDYWHVFYDAAQDDTLYGMIGKNSPTPSAYYTALEEVWQQKILGKISPEDAMSAAVDAAKGVAARNQ